MKCDTPEPPGLWGLQLGGRLGGRTCQSELKKAETTTPAERSRIEEDIRASANLLYFFCVRSSPPPRPSCVTAKQVSLSFHTSTQTHMFSIRPLLRTNFLFSSFVLPLHSAFPPDFFRLPFFLFPRRRRRLKQTRSLFAHSLPPFGPLPPPPPPPVCHPGCCPGFFPEQDVARRRLSSIREM